MRSALSCGILGICIGLPNAAAQNLGKLSVNVSGLRNDNGVVRCELYASAATFRKPGSGLQGVAARPTGPVATCVFNGIAAGNYAVAVFHAEQNEAQIEYGTFGKPKQGYGFSRNPPTTVGPPSFEAASFNYVGGTLALTVTLQY